MLRKDPKKIMRAATPSFLFLSPSFPFPFFLHSHISSTCPTTPPLFHLVPATPSFTFFHSSSLSILSTVATRPARLCSTPLPIFLCSQRSRSFPTHFPVAYIYCGR